MNATKRAIDTLADALSHVRDAATVTQFRAQQSSPQTLASAAPTTAPPDASPATNAQSQPGDIEANENIFKTIAVDAAPYEANIQKFRSHTDSIDYQLGAGNLLLLADRPAEAKACFESALQLATKGKGGKTREVRDALEGIARSIRDQDGSVAPADAFVLSMQNRATTQPSTDADPSPIAMTEAMRTAVKELKPSGITASQSPEDPAAKTAE